MKKYYIALAALLISCGTASAETINGMVMDVDRGGRVVTLRREDTQESVKVLVSDMSSLSRLQAGARVTLDAQKDPSGTLNTGSIQTLSAGLGGTNTASASVPAGVNVNAPVEQPSSI